MGELQDEDLSRDPAAVLHTLWNDGNPRLEDVAHIPADIRQSIEQAVNAPFKLIRYILPSQLLAKLVDPSRHALALQKQSDLSGSFDARSFCNRYIIAFDRANHRVLGGSADPGVGNLWRYPQIDEHWLNIGHRRKKGGDDLYSVLNYAENHPKDAERLLRMTLGAIAKRLKQTKIVYPRPNRISLDACIELIDRFLTIRTGGRRLQFVSAALFEVIGARFGLFDRVVVGHINKADAARGDVADLDCQGGDGKTVLSVEVKDRELTILEVVDALQVARDRGVAEILYLIRGGVAEQDQAAFHDFKVRQFAAGHNIYHIDFVTLLHTCLILFGETGRLTFLEAIANQLDTNGELSDRQAWQSELHNI